MHRLCKSVVVVLAFALCAVGQSAKSKGPKSGDEIVLQEVLISGTAALNSEQLNDIRSSLTSKTMSDDDELAGEYIRYEFQQRGYFDAEVTNLKVIPLDPLAKKKPVRIEAEVEEGPLFHLAEFKFTGNKTFSTDELRQMFPLHAGEVFDAEKVRLGIDSLRKRYSAQGFFECAPEPKTDKTADAQVTVTFAIEEGIQYRMGDLKIEGKSELAQKLERNWDLKPGEPYDPGYLEKFLTQNRELLPEGFDDDRDVLYMRDCADNTVNVTIALDPKRPWKPKPQDKPCAEEKDSPKVTSLDCTRMCGAGDSLWVPRVPPLRGSDYFPTGTPGLLTGASPKHPFAAKSSVTRNVYVSQQDTAGMSLSCLAARPVDQTRRPLP